MLHITIPKADFFNEETSEFISVKEHSLQLEHSLVSLSKWESKWQKPFLAKAPKTAEESADYIRCMTLTQNVDPLVYMHIPPAVYEAVNEYIEAPMTATWFTDREKRKQNREIVTAEVIYYWMISLEIPFECQKWHLNRLLALIRVCDLKNAPQKKMGQKEMLTRNKALNAERKAKAHSKG